MRNCGMLGRAVPFSQEDNCSNFTLALWAATSALMPAVFLAQIRHAGVGVASMRFISLTLYDYSLAHR
jgi:hypothetical protein